MDVIIEKDGPVTTAIFAPATTFLGLDYGDKMEQIQLLTKAAVLARFWKYKNVQ
jgi:hypothetical protein